MAEKNEKQLLKSIGVAVGIVIFTVIAALIVSSILGSSVFSQGDITGTNTNEPLGAVDNITAVDFAILLTAPTANCTPASVLNATDGTILSAGNYTQGTCTIILSDASTYIGEDLNVTYTYTYTGEGSGIIDVDEISDLFGEFIDGLLGFLGIIGIVLGVIWLVVYVAKLFKKNGLNDLGQTA